MGGWPGFSISRIHYKRAFPLYRVGRLKQVDGGTLLAALADSKSGTSEGGTLLAAHFKSGASEGGPLLAPPFKSGVSEDSALMGACLCAMCLNRKRQFSNFLPHKAQTGLNTAVVCMSAV